MFSGGLLGLVLLLFWMWAIFDVIVTPDGTQRHLPKLAWVIIVVLFAAFGAAAWAIAGRPRGAPIGITGRVGGHHPSDARDEASRMSERERLELEKRDYYRRMDEELDRRLEEKRRQEGDQP